MLVVTSFTVQQSDTDELGHLNHVAAIKMLEFARDDWYERAGLWGGRPWSESENLGTIVVNVNINYHKECFLGEVLEVKSIAVAMGTKSYTIGHEIIKPDGSIAVDCEAVSVIMDMEQRIAIPVPESICRYFPSR